MFLLLCRDTEYLFIMESICLITFLLLLTDTTNCNLAKRDLKTFPSAIFFLFYTLLHSDLIFLDVQEDAKMHPIQFNQVFAMKA